jgi:indole-3-glycerol phosphate synthase
MIVNLLLEIAARTKERIEARKKIVPSERLIEEARLLGVAGNFVFEKVLRADNMAFICEIKKASPSKGVIAGEFPYIDIARE